MLPYPLFKKDRLPSPAVSDGHKHTKAPAGLFTV